MKPSHLLALLLACGLGACATERPHRARSPEVRTVTVPGPDVITEATCTDEVWLLTHHEIERLASGSAPAPGAGYPLACCAEGVLPEHDRRCELDWPSSDVPHCSVWSDYRERLLAAHGDGPHPALVESNLSTLARWVTDKHHCVSE
ncbi:MAG: hypothetical protein QF464_07720 [Myxococcota bacterium]|jgi:hypothetical protein|nr:hypothetical protein [Myxococcota bacterium]